MGSGVWTYYFGNQVSYGQAGWFQAIIGVWDAGSNSGTSTEVQYRYSVKFGQSINDGSNTVVWSDPWGSGNANNTSFVFGAGGGEKVVGGPYSSAHPIQYGGGNTATFVLEVSGLAGVGGTSRVSVAYPLPPRAAAAPAAVSGRSFSNITATSFTHGWALQAGVSVYGYEVRKSTVTTSRSGTIVRSGEVAGSSINFTGLTRATSYVVHTRAYNPSVGWGPWNVDGGLIGALVKTSALPPTVASTYSVTAISRNSARTTGVSVTDNGGATPTRLRVQYNTSASTTGALVQTSSGWADVTMSSLTSDTQYFYRIAAENSAGWGAYGSWKSFTTLLDAPSDMDPPTFGPEEWETAFWLNWVEPAMNGATLIAYRYEVSLSPSFGALTHVGVTNELSVLIEGLQPGTEYFARVRANATPNNSGYGVASKTTAGQVPGSGIRVYACIDGQIHQGELYTFIAGVRQQLQPAYQNGSVLETE